MAVTAAALQPDTPLPPVISFKSLPKDLITHDPYAHLHTFSEDHHDVLQNNIPHQSFSLRIKDALPSKFIRFPSTSHTVTPHRHASSSFRKPSIGVTPVGPSVPAPSNKPTVFLHTVGAVDKVGAAAHVEHITHNHFPSLGYDIDSYFTGFPVFGFFDFNPDRAGLTTRTHLPPFPQFPEDIPLKGSKVSLHAPYHATHHTSKAMVTQQIHHKSRSNPKQFRTRVPRQAMFFLGPPSMPSNPKPRTSTILF
ncbi:uncharacterized protein LOC123505637 isoform X2 [Portunus trituberculatus]|nr:uncharacterized protein LOC123505637 isoform X2 [Portunus trituberculatus]